MTVLQHFGLLVIVFAVSACATGPQSQPRIDSVSATEQTPSDRPLSDVVLRPATDEEIAYVTSLLVAALPMETISKETAFECWSFNMSPGPGSSPMMEFGRKGAMKASRAFPGKVWLEAASDAEPIDDAAAVDSIVNPSAPFSSEPSRQSKSAKCQTYLGDAHRKAYDDIATYIRSRSFDPVGTDSTSIGKT